LWKQLNIPPSIILILGYMYVGNNTVILLIEGMEKTFRLVFFFARADFAFFRIYYAFIKCVDISRHKALFSEYR